MKKSIFTLLIVLYYTVMISAQSIANKDLIGEWYGPNQSILVLNANGTGYCDLGPLACQLRIISWSATSSKLSIHWDMKPIECKKLDSDGKFMHTPKIEFDNPEYTITKSQSNLAGVKTTSFSLYLNNKEYNTSGIYTRGEVEEPE